MFNPKQPRAKPYKQGYDLPMPVGMDIEAKNSFGRNSSLCTEDEYKRGFCFAGEMPENENDRTGFEEPGPGFVKRNNNLDRL